MTHPGELKDLLKNPLVRRALELAAPHFVASWDADPEDPQLQVKAYSYILRMSSRPTPYGMFAVMGLGTFGSQIDSLRIPSESFRVLLSPNEILIEKIYRKLAKDLRALKKSNLILNPSLSWVSENNLSAYAWDWPEGVRRYYLAQYELPELLASVIRSFPARMPGEEFIRLLRDHGAGTEEAEDILLELVSLCVFFPDFHPTSQATNLERLSENLPKSVLKASFENFSRKLSRGETATDEDLVPALRDPQISPVSAVALSEEPSGLSTTTQARMSRATDRMIRAFQNSASNHGVGRIISEVKQDFVKKFGVSFVPLKLAMSLLELSQKSPRQFPAQPTPGLDKFWAGKFLSGRPETGPWRIELTDSDWRALEEIDGKAIGSPALSPTSVCTLFSVGESTIQVKSILGPPGIAPLGRLSSNWPELSQVIREISAREQTLSPGVVFAEVDHFVMGKVHNIAIRETHLPMSIRLISGDHSGSELEVDDLYLGVREEELVLWSKSLGKRVIPQLSNNHGYQLDDFPLYRVLCFLRRDRGWSSVSISFGTLNSLDHHPRIEGDGVIYHPESWKLSPSDFPEKLRKSGREALGLPRFVFFIEGDRQTLLDLSSPLALGFIKDGARKLGKRSQKILFEEVPHLDDSATPGYMNQVVVPFSVDTCIRDLGPGFLPDLSKKHVPLSEECVYFSVFLPARSEAFLIRELEPFLARFPKKFYIRYSDPSYHIRVRLFGLSPESFISVIRELSTLAQRWLSGGLISDFRYPTYERELEVYGGPLGVHLFEELSFIDSAYTLAFTRTSVEDNLNKKRIWPSEEMFSFLVSHAEEYARLLFPDPRERLAFFIEKTRAPVSYPSDINEVTKADYGRRERKEFQRLKEPFLSAAPLNTPARAHLVKEFLRSFEQGKIHCPPGQLYFRMIHLLCNRLSWNLRPFHEQRIHQTVKARLLREKNRPDR